MNRENVGKWKNKTKINEIIIIQIAKIYIRKDNRTNNNNEGKNSKENKNTKKHSKQIVTRRKSPKFKNTFGTHNVQQRDLDNLQLSRKH